MDEWTVEIDGGRAGSIYYREGANCIRLDYEFETGDVLARAWGPSHARWAEVYPWATGRQSEILHRVADAVIRQKAPDCTAHFDPAHPDEFELRRGAA